MDNKSGSLLRIRPEKRISKAKQTEYYVLVSTWNMGENVPEYNCELFITAEQYQLISMSQAVKSEF